MSGQVAARKRIDEITMIKGVGITFVVLAHMSSIVGLLPRFDNVSRIITSATAPLMMVLIFASGYTRHPKDSGYINAIAKRLSRILLPYYKCTVVIIPALAIIYLAIERKSFAWFADGTLGILFQLQSFHYFDLASSGVHPMFYPVIVGWFLFQMAVSEILFVPLIGFLKGKNRIWKIVCALYALVSIVVMIIFVIKDDYMYDFPIGKWGAFGSYGYFLEPVYGLALFVFAAIICNLMKKVSLLKKYLIYMGDNSMDFLNIHFFVGFVAAYIGGFWYDYLNEPMPQ